MRTRRTLGIAALLAVLAAGCDGGDDGGGGGGGNTISWDDYGGYISIETYADPGFPETYLDATLFASIDFPGAEPSRITEPEIGTCAQDADGGGGDIPDITYLDAGNSITATGPEFSIVADLFTGGTLEYFEGYVDSAATGTFTVTVAGGADVPAGQIATITVPGPVTYDPITSVTPGEPLEITYDAPVGTSHVEIDLEHSEEDVYITCWADPDDTSFTVPGSMTELVDADAFVDVYGESHQFLQIAGKTVIVSGESYQ